MVLVGKLSSKFVNNFYFFCQLHLISCCLCRYFSVFWCKASAKKHKNWEEDAVLVVKARAVTLKVLIGQVLYFIMIS